MNTLILNPILSILNLFSQAAAGLPLIACLSLIAARRQDPLFCIWGAYRLLNLCSLLAICGLLYFGGSFWAQVALFDSSLAQKLSALFQPGGLPWTYSLIAWLAGWLFAMSACARLAWLLTKTQANPDNLSFLRLPITLCLLAAFCFCASFFLINWPFAGLPENMEWDRAFMAIARHALHQYFMALCPAGALALLAAIRWTNGLNRERLNLSIRWLAAWACAGCLPTIIQNWGRIIGLGASGYLPMAMQQGFWAQLSGLICITLALAAWVFAIWRPKIWRPLAMAGFCLLLLKTVSQFIFK